MYFYLCFMKTLKYLLSYIFLISCTVFYSCKKDNLKDGSGSITLVTTGNKLAPDGFNFSTITSIKLNLTLKSNTDKPLSGIMVNFYAPNNTATGQEIFRAFTDRNGQLASTITVPSYLKQLVIDPNTIGVLRMAVANINNNNINAVIGGKDGFSGDVITSVYSSQAGSQSFSNIKTNSITIPCKFPAGYNSSNAYMAPDNLGRPAWLEPTPDAIDPTLLKYINSSLPERQSVLKTHPQYLDNAVNVIRVINKSEISVTFVSGITSNHNTLAYYTYPTNNPPATVSDISYITYLFPNVRFKGDGGNLSSGDKINLGTFDAGTTIAFVLMENSWSGSAINFTAQTFFSQNNLNPETNAALKQHSIVLYDVQHQLDLIAFEDANRQTQGSDNDFNDVVVYATATNPSDIDNSGVPPIDTGCPDSDGDGVDDCHDQFPSDPGKSYTSYYPCPTCYANVAFEDNWPNKGDYDLNDLVVNYQYEFISNAQNQVVSMVGKFSLAAAGASFKNGFGLQLPVSSSAVASVTGQKLSNGTYIQLAGNGVEAGQSKAVLIPFDTHDMMAHNPDYSFFINTLMDKDRVKSDTAVVTVNFTSPIDPNVLTPAVFNPFLISNMRRGYEVHLPGFKPTDKADPKLFGTGDDKSNPATGKYYLTADNWPWALNYLQVFNYPIETVNITQAYLHFADWASSGGALYQDWYSNTDTGYRDHAYIYSK